MLSRDEIARLDDKALLAKIAEESGEIVQAAMKQHAHGPFPFHNGKQYDNPRDVQTEFSQLASLIAEHALRWA